MDLDGQLKRHAQQLADLTRRVEALEQRPSTHVYTSNIPPAEASAFAAAGEPTELKSAGGPALEIDASLRARIMPRAAQCAGDIMEIEIAEGETLAAVARKYGLTRAS